MTDLLFDTSSASGAVFSPCRTWRYSLWRQWSPRDDGNRCMFIGLNPSTADERQDDPTIRRCIRFAKDWGYGGLVMMNAFAFRATLPPDMLAADDPVGPGNDEELAYQRNRVSMIVAAWGVNCPAQRAAKVCQVIGRPIHCLGRTKGGQPKHPLYLRADSTPELFWDCTPIPQPGINDGTRVRRGPNHA